MKVKFIYGIISASIVSTLLLMNHVSAVLDWQDEVDVQFTFNPALSVSISEGDIVIPNLGVGTRDDSNEITITVGTGVRPIEDFETPDSKIPTEADLENL